MSTDVGCPVFCIRNFNFLFLFLFFFFFFFFSFFVFCRHFDFRVRQIRKDFPTVASLKAIV